MGRKTGGEQLAVAPGEGPLPALDGANARTESGVIRRARLGERQPGRARPFRQFVTDGPRPVRLERETISFKGKAMTLILELEGGREAALKAKAQALGVSAEQLVQQIVNRELEQPEELLDRPARRISQRIAEIMADVPREEFAKLPKDGARQVDHYVYGLPKRD